MKNFAQNQLPAIAWVGIIFWLSTLHRIPAFRIPMSDKLAHGVFYGVLCGLSYRAFFFQSRFTGLKRCAVLAALLFTILYGVSDEIHQLFVWGRTSDILDIAADSIGGFIAASFMTFWLHGNSAAAASELKKS